MTLTDITQQPANTIDAFNATCQGDIGLCAYDPAIEEASDDQLRCWIIEQGVTDEEIEDRFEVGETLQDIAQELSISTPFN